MITVPEVLRHKAAKVSNGRGIAQQAARWERELRDCCLREELDTLRLQNLARGAHPHVGDSDSGDRLARAIALISLAIQRRGGPVPHDAQRHAAVVMARGGVAEMATGEGKTLATALAAAALAVGGQAVHVATANDYLARRDCQLFQPAFQELGLTSGCLLPRDPDDQKRQVYGSDLVYGTANALAFDYLRDRVAKRQRKQQPWTADAPAVLLNQRRAALVIDEIDHVLIDEAATPLVLAGPPTAATTDQQSHLYRLAYAVCDSLAEGLDWRWLHGAERMELTAAGEQRCKQILQRKASGLDLLRPWSEYIHAALMARYRLRRNVDYVIQDARVQIIDPATGRIDQNRQWQSGLHQAVEVEAGLQPSVEQVAIAQITRWRFFDLYRQIGGCSGTAWLAAREFSKVYRLATTRIALRKPSRRRNLPAKSFPDQAAKFSAIVADVRQLQQQGRPVLLGTESVRESLALQACLDQHQLRSQLLNGLQPASEAAVIAAAGRSGAITIATDLAGRGTDIPLDDQARRRGGLHVIVVSPRHSPRLDQQLIGRCARQGDPGSARTYISADDSLLQRHAPWVTGRNGDWSKLADRIARRCDRQAALQRMQLAARDRQREAYFDPSHQRSGPIDKGG